MFVTRSSDDIRRSRLAPAIECDLGGVPEHVPRADAYSSRMLRREVLEPEGGARTRSWRARDPREGPAHMRVTVSGLLVGGRRTTGRSRALGSPSLPRQAPVASADRFPQRSLPVFRCPSGGEASLEDVPRGACGAWRRCCSISTGVSAGAKS